MIKDCGNQTNRVNKVINIVNQLPCKKNPFFVIAHPSSFEIKDRKIYCNSQTQLDQDTSIKFSENFQCKTFNNQQINRKNSRSVRGQNFQSSSVSSQILSQVEIQNQHLELQGEILRDSDSQFKSKSVKPSRFCLKALSCENKASQQSYSQILRDNFERKIIQNPQFEIDSKKIQRQPTKCGVIVKNLYKRNYLSRKSTMKTEDTQKFNFSHSNTNQFSSNSRLNLYQIQNNRRENQTDKENFNQQIDNQPCLGEESNGFFKKIQTFFN